MLIYLQKMFNFGILDKYFEHIECVRDRRGVVDRRQDDRLVEDDDREGTPQSPTLRRKRLA